MSEDTGRSVRIDRRFSETPEKIWQAWTDPDIIRSWFGSDPGGTVLAARVDLRTGGSSEVTFENADGSRYTCSGNYIEIPAGERLSFMWTWKERPGPVESVVVRVEEHDGGTKMAFQHSNIDPTTSHNYGMGWRSTFDKLERALKKIHGTFDVP